MIFFTDFMKRSGACGVALLLAASAWSQPVQPVYENTSDFDMVYGTATVPPQINATIFINQALFWLDLYTGDPYDTQSTLFLTNKTSGYMYCSPGFRFDFITNSSEVTTVRSPMASFHNQGIISGGDYLTVSATNIFSPGALAVYRYGLLRLTGNNVNISRSLIYAGPNPYMEDSAIYDGLNIGRTYYYNPPGVKDAYWAVGQNGSFGTNGARLALPVIGTRYFEPPYAATPTHQVLERTAFTGTRPVTNTYTLPSFDTGSYGLYTAYAVSNQITLTSSVVQVVFVPTNNATLSKGLITSRVRFDTTYGAANPIVEFSAPYYDRVERTNKVNAFYLIDNSATVTNFTYLANVSYFNMQDTGGAQSTNKATGTLRPNVYETSMSEPYGWTYGVGPNLAYTNTLFYGTNFLTNAVNYIYSAYSAILNPPFTNSLDTTGVNDPSNSVGRVEIVADQLDLRQARIKAENFLSIKTTNLIGNTLAVVDAPVINYDLGSTAPVLSVSNLVAKSYNRLSGQVYAWSAVWTVDSVVSNDFTGLLQTNHTKFHVLFADFVLDAQLPVVLNEFAVRGTNVVIYDPLVITKSLMVDAESLRVAAEGTNVGSITLPAGTNWLPQSFPRLDYFTNEGVISISGSGNFYRLYDTNDLYGQPVTLERPYQVWNNSGMITGASHVVQASNLVNSGTFVATSGGFDIVATNALLDDSFWIGRSDLRINAANLDVTNSMISVGGTLVLNVTNRLSDGGPTANNYWEMANGFSLDQRPQSGDLLGTRIYSWAYFNSLVSHVWSGENRGVSPAGFSNNAALGSLVLVGGEYSLFHFAGAGTNDALYVDYLEFVDYATNIQTALAVETNLTIYFANANISPDKLNGALRGRLKWVYNYTGANSTTNILVDGRLVPMNTALMQSAYSDLDADGIPNKVDTTPLLSGSSLDLQVEYVRLPMLAAQISWYAIKGSTSYVEYRTSLVGGNWVTLTALLQGPTNGRLTVVDPVRDGQQRYYRVRVEPVIGLAQP